MKAPPLDVSPLLTAPTIRALEQRFQKMHPTVRYQSKDYYAMRAALRRRGYELVEAHPLGEWIPRIVKSGRWRGIHYYDVTYRGQSGRFETRWGAVYFKHWVNKVGGFRVGKSHAERCGGPGGAIVDWICEGYPHRAIKWLPKSKRLRPALASSPALREG